MKNILYWFIDGQTLFEMPRGAQLSLALNEARWVVLYLDSNTTSELILQVERNNFNIAMTLS